MNDKNTLFAQCAAGCLVLIFWAVVAYVAFHFITKWW
jgi:hypothetical protein